VQEAVIPRWANGVTSVFHAAAAAAWMTWPGESPITYLYFTVSLATLCMAVLAAVAAVASRGLLARPRLVVSVSFCRNFAIFNAVLGLLLLAVALTSEFRVRDLGIVFIMCANAVQQFGLWTDVMRRTAVLRPMA
jgi:hypothetical protein